MPKRVYFRANACIRFSGEDLDPLIVTQALRLPPDLQYRRGEPRLRRSKKGKVLEHSPHRFGLWSMSSEKWVDSPRLAVHLDWLLNQLEPLHDPIQALFQRGWKADFYCCSMGRAPESPSIPKDIRARADRLGIPIEIDHQFLSDDERPPPD